MTILENLQSKWSGLALALSRYPLALIPMVCAAAVNAHMINHNTESHLAYLFTFLIGALMSAVAQHIYERFFQAPYERLLLMGLAVVLTIAYYFAVGSDDEFHIEMNLKTDVAIFALLMAFVAVPSIKSRLTFNQTFLAAFKAFFTAMLFSVVLAIGLNVTLFAVDSLLFPLDGKIYSHVLNIVFLLLAPLFFLSFIPQYPGTAVSETTQQKAKTEKAITCPKTLDVLISHMIIPLAGIYTVVLLAYVLLNIRSDFWTDNLLEPMLVSYAITVILIYILASNLGNPFASLFRKVFPKVLIPIVLFQTIASVLKVGEMGVTHGRYYVILFGVFAVIAAVIFSFFSTRKNGWISAMLIIAAAVSIIPPVDAFTLGKSSQIHLLQRTLTDNGMLDDGEIVAKSDIPTRDKKKITGAVDYLRDLHDTDQIDCLPDHAIYGGKFKETFGFNETYDESETGPGNVQFANLDTTTSPAINTKGYEQMIRLYIGDGEASDVPVKIDGATYKLKQKTEDQTIYLTLTDDHDQKLLTFDAEKAFSHILEKGKTDDLTVDEATVTHSNDKARVRIVADSVHYSDGEYDADLYVLIGIL